MMHKRPRPGSATATGEVLKLHRHTVVADGRGYTVITLRRGADVRFSTNRFHGTWHVLSDWRGAQTLARLMWGLAFQRKHGTLALITRACLDPNPFDAAAADPIALVPTNLTVLSHKAARAIRRHFSHPQFPQGTVRWRSHGLTLARAQEREWQGLPRGLRRYPFVPKANGWQRVDRIGGLVTFAGPPPVLKEWSVEIARLGEWASHGMDYTESQWPDGEVQVFRQYRSEVRIAEQARHEVLQNAQASLTPDSLERQIWDHAETVRRRRLPLPA
jgi:hypothetical protein